MDSPTLKAMIQCEFNATPYPGDNNIVPEDSYNNVLESRQIADYFRGRKWQDITLADLREGYIGDPSACLTFMTPSAFRFYLPAYLFICIESFSEADMIYDTTIRRLIIPNNSEDLLAFHERFVPFTIKQKQIVAKFLRQMDLLHDGDRVGHDAKRALDGFWSSYLT